MIKFEGIAWAGIDWQLHSEEPGQTIWLNKYGEGLVAARAKNPPDIPPLGDAAAERETQNYFRRSMLSMDGGIVDVRYDTVCGLRAVRVLVKCRMKPRGFAFLGTWLIPFAKNFLTFRFECYERGTTGVRETAVMMIEMPKPAADEKGRIVGWLKDPYDSRFDDQALYNIADAEKYDAMFPQHPLSRVRYHLADFQKGASADLLMRMRKQHLARR